MQKSGMSDLALRESLQLVWGRRFSCDVATGMIPLGDLFLGWKSMDGMVPEVCLTQPDPWSFMKTTEVCFTVAYCKLIFLWLCWSVHSEKDALKSQ